MTIAADAIEPGEFEQGHKLFMRPFDHDLGIGQIRWQLDISILNGRRYAGFSAGIYHQKGNEVMIGGLGFWEHLMEGMIATGYRKKKGKKATRLEQHSSGLSKLDTKKKDDANAEKVGYGLPCNM